MINYSLLSNTILFRGIAPEEIASMLKCLGGKTKRFQKDSVIYPEIMGSDHCPVGLMLKDD